MSARQRALELACLKAVKDRLTALDTETKAALMDGDLDPGDRKSAVLPDGTDVGTVSVAKGRAAKLKVVDERAFLAWVKKNRPTAIVEAVRSSDQDDLLAKAEESGELPDGVDLGDPGAPYVSVRQSKEQAEALVAAWRAGTVALPGLVAGQVES